MLTLSLVMAGCADQAGTGGSNDGDGGADDGGAPQTEMTNAEAESLLKSSAETFPERFGFEMKAFAANDAEAFVISGAMDNATGESLFDIRGDPQYLGGSQGGDDADESQTAVFREGFTMYTSKEGSLYYANGTAFVFPADRSGSSDGFVPAPEDSPFASLGDPSGFVAQLEHEGIDVKSVKPVTHRGKAAVAITFESKDNETNETMQGVATVYTQSKRVAKFEGTTQAKTADEPNRFVMEFLYDSDVKLTPPAAISRAVGLSYTSDATPFGGGTENDDGTTTVTWTFQGTSGVAVGEVELLAFAPSEGDSENGFDFSKRTPAFKMLLSAGSAEGADVKAVFTDADGSGTVTKGDTLAITKGDSAGGHTFVLHDTKTDTYVVPGPVAWMLLAGIGAAALLARRK